MNTNVILPDVYYQGEDTKLKWRITSLPPYYCGNTSGAQDFSADFTWLGVSMFDGVNTNTRYTSGIKFAYTIGDEREAGTYGGGNDPIYIENAIGQSQTLVPLNKAGGAYNTDGTNNGIWGLQHTYRPGGLSGVPFGPYDLDKTTDSTPYPAADGDIIIITTGSDVLAGTIADPAYGSGDTRIFNLLFYSTGSNEVQDLVAGVFSNNAAGTLNSYAQLSRYQFQTHADVRGSMSFVACPTNNPSNLLWWPITWDDNSPQVIQTRNDA